MAALAPYWHEDSLAKERLNAPSGRPHAASANRPDPIDRPPNERLDAGICSGPKPRNTPGMARAAKAAARVLLTAAGVPDADEVPQPVRRRRRATERKKQTRRG